MGMRGRARRVRKLAHASVPVTSDAREAREIVWSLRQRGERAGRLPAARGGGWARVERLSGERHVYRTHVPRTRKRCRVCGTVKRKLQRKSMLHETRALAGRGQAPARPGQDTESTVTEALADVRKVLPQS